MNNKKKYVIVTGGAGYIGSSTVIALDKADFVPIIVDNLCNSSITNINGINKILDKKIIWHNINCCDYDGLIKIFKKYKNIVACIHFAAFKSVSESVKKPEKYFKNNIESLKNLINCMKINKIDNLIFSSSCTVYGTPDTLPVNEKAKFKKAESPYGETKQIGEKIILENKLNSISLRYFNPIGVHSSLLIGDCSNDNANNLVPIVTEVAIGKRKELVINGNDYNTEDGTCIRDYIHVEDLASAHVKSLFFLLKNKGKHVFNVGTGVGISVLEIVSSFERINKINLNYKFGPRRKGDVDAIFSDTKKMERETNWKAIMTIDSALKSAWEWEKMTNNKS